MVTLGGACTPERGDTLSFTCHTMSFEFVAQKDAILVAHEEHLFVSRSVRMAMFEGEHLWMMWHNFSLRGRGQCHAGLGGIEVMRASLTMKAHGKLQLESYALVPHVLLPPPVMYAGPVVKF